MNSLVVFYTRTGTTKKVAEELANALNCDLEEIFDTKKCSGPIGYMGAGRDASARKLTELKPIAKNPGQYDRVILGTPIWNWNMSAPIRTYIQMYKNKFGEVTFFCTCGGNPGKVFPEMEEICGKKPLAVLELIKKDFKDGTDATKIGKFIGKLR
ncbi:MAG: hypothetical protein KAJ51_00975 [Thermoplasmata archaeon]|nr:hypothetical protein [Thermoplasmata archaeon]